jgi:hypothetical protein
MSTSHPKRTLVTALPAKRLGIHASDCGHGSATPVARISRSAFHLHIRWISPLTFSLLRQGNHAGNWSLSREREYVTKIQDSLLRLRPRPQVTGAIVNNDNFVRWSNRNFAARPVATICTVHRSAPIPAKCILRRYNVSIRLNIWDSDCVVSDTMRLPGPEAAR